MSTFGLDSETDEKQRNYMYSERAAGNGSDEVQALLFSFLVHGGIIVSSNDDFDQILIESSLSIATTVEVRNKHQLRIFFMVLHVQLGICGTVQLGFVVKGRTRMPVIVILVR